MTQTRVVRRIPDGMGAVVHEFDARVGGRFHPDGFGQACRPRGTRLGIGGLAVGGVLR